MKSISVFLEEEVLKKIEDYAKDNHLERSALIRKFILDGFQNAILEQNIHAILRDELSIEQAAHDADVSVFVLLDFARKIGIEIG